MEHMLSAWQQLPESRKGDLHRKVKVVFQEGGSESPCAVTYWNPAREQGDMSSLLAGLSDKMEWEDKLLHDMKVEFANGSGGSVSAFGVGGMHDLLETVATVNELSTITIKPVVKEVGLGGKVSQHSEAIKEWLQSAKRWICGDDRSSEKDVHQAQERLEQRARGRLVGPQQRCAVLKDEGYSKSDLDAVVPVLSRQLCLSKEQEEDLHLASKRDSSERYYRQDDVTGAHASTPIIRHRTRCEGEKVRLTYGFCEMPWQWHARSGAVDESAMVWNEHGNNLSIESGGQLVTSPPSGSKGWRSARADLGTTSGVIEWDVIPHRTSSAYMIAGICTAGMPLDGYHAEHVIGLGRFGTLRRGLCRESIVSNAAWSFGVNDVIGFRLDLTAGTLWATKNGVPLFDVPNLSGRGPFHAFVALRGGDQACWIRERSAQSFTSELINEVHGYAERRADHQFALQLQVAPGAAAAAGPRASAV